MVANPFGFGIIHLFESRTGVDVEAGRHIIVAPFWSSKPTMVAIPRNTCIIQPMNKILLSKMHRLANGRLVVPFSCPEASGYHLHEPAYNRTEAEQEMAEKMARRLRLALAPLGYHLEGVNWSSMHLTVTENA